MKYRRSTATQARGVRAFSRRYALAGGLVGVALPYAYGVSEFGFQLGRSVELIGFFAGLMLFCGLIGAAVATRNFGSSGSRKPGVSDDQFWSDKEAHDQMTHQGLFAYRRDQ